MIEIKDDVDSLQLIQVMEYLDRRGCRRAKIYKGNDCIWVASGSAERPLNEYFIFRNGQLSNVYVD